MDIHPFWLLFLQSLAVNKYISFNGFRHVLFWFWCENYIIGKNCKIILRGEVKPLLLRPPTKIALAWCQALIYTSFRSLWYIIRLVVQPVGVVDITKSLLTLILLHKLSQMVCGTSKNTQLTLVTISQTFASLQSVVELYRKNIKPHRYIIYIYTYFCFILNVQRYLI